MKNGIIVYGFPSIGKSTLCNSKENQGRFLDLESSDYQWVFTDEMKKMSVEERKGIEKQKNPEWPENYTKAIIQARKSYDYIFIAHEGKIQCQKNNIPYWLIFPDHDCKDEYIQRMRARGNPEEFVAKIAQNYDNFVKGCFDDPLAERKIVMKKGEYLADIFKRIELENNQDMTMNREYVAENKN